MSITLSFVSLYLSLSLFLSLCLSVCLLLSLSVSLFLYHSLCLSFSLFSSLPLSFSLSFSLFPSLSLSLSYSFSLFYSHLISVSFFLSLSSVFLSLLIFTSKSVFFYFFVNIFPSVFHIFKISKDSHYITNELANPCENAYFKNWTIFLPLSLAYSDTQNPLAAF